MNIDNTLYSGRPTDERSDVEWLYMINSMLLV